MKNFVIKLDIIIIYKKKTYPKIYKHPPQQFQPTCTSLKSIHELALARGRDGGGCDYAARRVSASSRIGDRLESCRKVYTLASDSASRAADANFTQNAKPYIETQTQWPRQVGRGAVLAARARVRETATPVHSCTRVYVCVCVYTGERSVSASGACRCACDRARTPPHHVDTGTCVSTTTCIT